MRILLTSGPTREYFDPVRFISNASSGRMGAALARAALAAGHDVQIVSGPVGVEYPAAVPVVWVESTLEMLAEAERLFDSADAVVGAAAPADYRPPEKSPVKIKKDAEYLTVRLVRNPDIIGSLAAKKGKRIACGFALETNDCLANARAKLDAKDLDLIVLNRPDAAESARTTATIIAANGDETEYSDVSKDVLAEAIIGRIEEAAGKDPIT